MTSKEYLRTIWFQEPKEITADILCSAMERYANYRVNEEIEYRTFYLGAMGIGINYFGK